MDGTSNYRRPRIRLMPVLGRRCHLILGSLRTVVLERWENTWGLGWMESGIRCVDCDDA